MPEGVRHAAAGQRAGLVCGRLANTRRDRLHRRGVNELTIGHAQRKTGRHQEQEDPEEESQRSDVNEAEDRVGADRDERRGADPREQGTQRGGGRRQRHDR